MKYVAICNNSMDLILRSDKKNKANDGGIWLYLCSIDKPLTITEIAKHFHKFNITVYKSLCTLVELGVVDEIMINHASYYQANKNTYYHTDIYHD